MTKPRIYSDKERKERRAILTRNYAKYSYLPNLKTSFLSYTGVQKKMLDEDTELQELFKKLTKLHKKIEEDLSKYKTICQNKKECISEMEKNYYLWIGIKKKISIRKEQILLATKNGIKNY